LETMRKAALQIAKGCPVCDGACRIPPKP
jgi:hypothetical protein